MNLVLASQSPRRKELLSILGIPFSVVPSSIGEAPAAEEKPEEFVVRLAREKGVEVASRVSHSVILSADTVVTLDGVVLVKAITGIDADRLKEEKDRGITIDIGFANLVLDADTTIGFIDVPGHERFIKNMLAGVGGIDMVMLVIAADESVMPQTREHLDICSL